MSVITREDVERAERELVVAAGDIVTPLALDRAKELGISLKRGEVAQTVPQRSVKRRPVPARDHPIGASAAAIAATGLAPRVTSAATPTLSGALYRRGAPLPQELKGLAVAPQGGAERRPKLAVIGAGHVGAMTTFRLAELDAFSLITMIDVVPGLAAGLALDMWHGSPLRHFTSRIEGSTDLDALAGAHVVVITAGKPRQPGMSRTDLTAVNAAIVTAVAHAIRRHAPDAVVVVVTNPLEEMTYLTCRETRFGPERVVGMAGVLDSARFCSLVALTGIARPEDVRAVALGSHGTEMVIPLSQATVNGTLLEQLLEPKTLAAIVERTRESGAEVVKLLQKGSAYFSPAESAASMVRSIVRNEKNLFTACVQSGGTYGIVDTRVGLPVRLGRGGVAEIVELPLRPDELVALGEAAAKIADRIRALG
jgi:malate dehydrogenase